MERIQIFNNDPKYNLLNYLNILKLCEYNIIRKKLCIQTQDNTQTPK